MDTLTLVLIGVAAVAIVGVLIAAVLQKKSTGPRPGLQTAAPSPTRTIEKTEAAPRAIPADQPKPVPAPAPVRRAEPKAAPAPKPAPASTPTPAPVVAAAPAAKSAGPAPRSLDDLTDAQRVALGSLTLLTADCDRAAALAVAECTDADLDAFIALEAVACDADTGRLNVRESARVAAAEHLSTEDAHAARLRHAAHYTASAAHIEELQQAAAQDKAGRDRSLEALELFEADLPHYRAAVDFMAAQRGLELQLVACVGALAQLASVNLDAADHTGWLQARLAAARTLGDRAAECDTLAQLGLASTEAGEHRKAVDFHEQALALARLLNDPLAEGRNLGNMALSWHRLGNTANAVTGYQAVVGIMRDIGDRPREGIALASLGQAYADNGDHRKALDYFQQHLAIARDTADRSAEMVALINVGNAHLALGEHDAAIKAFEHQLQLAQRSRQLPTEGNAVHNLGRAHRAAGNLDQAISYFEQLAHVSQLMADGKGECLAVGLLGETHLKAHHTSKAIECFDRQLKLARQNGERRSEAEAHWQSALAIHSRGQIGDAVTRGEVALHIFEELDAPETAPTAKMLAAWRAQA